MNRTASTSRRLLRPLLALVGAGAGLAYGALAAKLPFGPPLVVLGLGGMTLVLCALALYRMLDPLLRTGPDRLEVVQEPVRLRELERDKQAVLKAIREIEHDFQMRRINDADYKAMSERYRARALRLMRDIDAGDDFRSLIEQELKTRLAAADSAAEAGPATPGCPDCGTVNDADAQFCKKCGKGLRPAVEAKAIS